MPKISYVMPKTKIVVPVDQHWFLKCAQFITFILLLVPSYKFVSFNFFSRPTLALILAIYMPFMIWNLSTTLPKSIQLLTKPFSLLLLWVLFVASYFWSVLPSISLGIILEQSAYIILALSISITCEKEGFSGPLRISIIVLLILATVYSIAVPYSFLSANGAESFYPQKNALGAYMGLSVLILINARGRNRLHIGFAVLAILLLLASRSKTSIGVVILCTALLPMANYLIANYQLNGRRGVLGLFLYPFSLSCLVTLVLFRHEFLTYFWSHLTKSLLTGRGLLWMTVIQHTMGNSLLGIGPGTFWNSGSGGGSEISHSVLFFTSPDFIQLIKASDGSYIDLIASIGVLGLALFLYTAVDLYRGLVRHWDQPDSKLIFVLTTFALLHAVTETTIFSSCNFVWLVYLLCYFRVASYGHASQPSTLNR